MPRENSFSDDGRSLTPDLDDNVSFASPDKAEIYIVVPEVVRQPDVTSSSSSENGRKQQTYFHLPNPTSSAKDKFRSTVRKVIRMHRTSLILSRYGVGDEPGVDPRRQSAYLNYSHVRQECVIELADYSSLRSSFGRMTNIEFVNFLKDPSASRREPWSKVRWINVAGVSWDVLSALAIRYDLHPLAIEDILQQRGNSRSKVDYYLKHLFLSVLCHTLDEDDDEDPVLYLHKTSKLPRSSSPQPMTTAELDHRTSNSESARRSEDDQTFYGSSSVAGNKFPSRTSFRRKAFSQKSSGDVEARVDSRSALAPSAGRKEAVASRRREHAQVAIAELKKGETVNVKVNPMYIFLLRNGTVISIQRDNNIDFTAPIMARLRQTDTGLRTSADPSLLVQSLLDLVVDSALEVVDAYHEKVLNLERDVLLRPNMKVVRELHVMSGELTLHKRTLEPLKTVVYGLRRYDQDRAAALVDTSAVDDGGLPMTVEGFMSHKSKIYLADVVDHMEYILASMDMFAGIAENLINYTFNMTSYEMNEVMRRLTLATIIFLPLTLLTGYFGMNFVHMWSVDFHTDVFFWEIALPLMAVVIPIFIWPDIRRMAHYIRKKILVRKAVQTFRRT